MRIPLGNLYFILSYALSDFFVAEKRNVSGTHALHPMDLLCTILIREAESLLKHGLHQSYIASTSIDGSIRGKIDFQRSIKAGALARRRLVCHHDELSADSELNRIIKSTLMSVSDMEKIAPLIRKRAARLSTRFPGAGRVPLANQSFSIRIDRNLKRYALAIGVCRLIHNSTLVDGSGLVRFVDFTRDEVAMRDIFERFIRNLLRHKLCPPLAVTRRRFPFSGLVGTDESVRLVPTMNTDAVVMAPESALVVEVKYVPGATTTYRDVERFRSTHLYQIYSYLRNFPSDGRRVSGLLVYPASNGCVSAAFSVDGLPIGVEEIRLDKDWTAIEAQIVGAVTSSLSRLGTSLPVVAN